MKLLEKLEIMPLLKLFLHTLLYLSITISCEEKDGSADITKAEEFSQSRSDKNGNKHPPDCECVPYYLCMNGTIITNGVWENIPIIDVRMKRFLCEDIIDECCLRPPDATSSKSHKTRGCGFRNPEGVTNSVNSSTPHSALFGEFPWMVVVFKKIYANDSTVNVYKCGASLIHPQVVATTPNCIENDNLSELRIRAGDWDTQHNNEFYSHQDRKVISITSYNMTDGKVFKNGVTLLFLSKPLIINDYINTICLPLQDEKFDNKRCFVSGWGNKTRSESVIKKFELTMIDRSECRKILRRNNFIHSGYLHKGFICVGGKEEQAFCDIDDGSPLVCPLPGISNRYVLAGMVAWRVGCEERGIPGIYWSVSHFRNWIERSILHFESLEYDGS